MGPLSGLVVVPDLLAGRPVGPVRKLGGPVGPLAAVLGPFEPLAGLSLFSFAGVIGMATPFFHEVISEAGSLG